MAIYEILASSTSEIQGITCFIIQLFIAEAMFFFHLKKRKRFWLRLLVGGTACLLLGVTLPIIIGQYISGIRTFIVLVFMQLYMWFCFRRSFFGYFILYNWSFYCTESWKQYSGADLYRDQNFFQDAFHGNGHWIYHCIYYLLSYLCSKNKKFSEYQPEQSPCTLGSHYFLMCLLAPSKLADQ